MGVLAESKCISAVRHLPSLIALVFLSCASSISPSERMEGFKDGVLRVYVRAPSCDNSTGDCVMPQKDILLAAGKKREELLLQNHLNVIHMESKIDLKLLEHVPLTVGLPTIVFQRCTDDECEAFIDYDAKAFLDSLKKLPPHGR
jgi:hypothetical protein